MRARFLILLTAAVALLSAPAKAAKDRVFTLQAENDVMTPHDRWYTSGVRFSVAFGEDSQPGILKTFADAVPFLAENYETRIIGLALSQNMFTPADTSESALIPDDRPYAGWLYAAFTVEGYNGNSADYFTLQLGVVGPAALGKQTQDAWHGLFGFKKSQGWDNQLRNEPGLLIAYQRTWQGAAQIAKGLQLGSAFHLGAAVGNVQTYGAGGVMFRLGNDLSLDRSPPPRISPGLPGSGYFKAGHKAVWYVFAGLEMRGIARNIFLDGNTWRNSHEVAKKHMVADFQIGIAVIVNGVRIAYTHVFRTREFRSQPEGHEFGALSFAFRF